ncbi:MAG TPA: DUF2784 domain-containing protein [Gemmataceae bacterium]|nr:DUF2784 domain-containing protein [Gemmataceae bacterium]
MGYGFLADLIVALHVAYVSFIVVGQLAILIGLVLRWRWVRNPWFRLSHLMAIVLVALEAVFGIDCPLTVWEANLRQLAGQEFSGESFMGRLLHWVIFYQAAPWTLNAIHIGFAILVLVTLLLAPPRWRRRSTSKISSETPLPAPPLGK